MEEEDWWVSMAELWPFTHLDSVSAENLTWKKCCRVLDYLSEIITKQKRLLKCY